MIPAGEANYEVKGSGKSGMMSRPINREILLTSVMPHMHWLGKDFTFTAVLPDELRPASRSSRSTTGTSTGKGLTASRSRSGCRRGPISRWSPTSTTPTNNPANPSKPPKVVHWGEQTTDEMCIGIFEFIAAEGTDGPTPTRPRAETKEAGQARP